MESFLIVVFSFYIKKNEKLYIKRQNFPKFVRDFGISCCGIRDWGVLVFVGVKSVSCREVRAQRTVRSKSKKSVSYLTVLFLWAV
jgi:hypothetical protein